MQRCLITGSSGLIGSKLIKLLKNNWEIHSLMLPNIEEPLGFLHKISCDMSHEWIIDGLPKNVDAIIHLAQSEKFRMFPEYTRDVFNVNTASTMWLLDYARQAGARTFILASTGGVYDSGVVPLTEEAIINCNVSKGFYASTKICSELLAGNYRAFMNIIILRFFFVYGPGQQSDMLVPRLINNIKNGNPVYLSGTNGFVTNPTYVADAAKSIYCALNLDGSHIINVAGPEVLSLRQITDYIGSYLKIEPQYEVNYDIKPANLIADISKMRRLLTEPIHRFEDSIPLLIE